MDYFNIEMQWNKTNDPFCPLSSCVHGLDVKLRLNDYPEEPMYTLIVNDEIIESFDEWPSAWKRPKT